MRYTGERGFALQFASRRQRARLIHVGKLLANGPPDEVAARYQELLQQQAMLQVKCTQRLERQQVANLLHE